MAKHKHKDNEKVEEKDQQATENKVADAAGNEAASASANQSEGGSQTEPNGQNTPQQVIDELTQKLADANDKYIRLSAEFDNFRKRTIKEKADLIKTASGTLLSDLLPVVDDFERARQSMENTDNVVAVKEGVTLIYNKFKELMKTKGLVEIEALNQPFDTDLHEALTKIPAPTDDLKGKVVDVVQKGYIVDEKVVRFAKVVVGE